MNQDRHKARAGTTACTPRAPAGSVVAVILGTLTVLLVPVPSASQPPFGTTENPEGAVRLRTIWVKTGGAGIGRVGTNATGIGDVNSDGYDDVSVRIDTEHYIYLGGDPMSLDPVQVLDSAGFPGSNYPVVGDFFGTGEKLYGYFHSRRNPNNGVVFVRMRFYRWDVDSMMVLTGQVLDLRVQPASEKFMSADLDLDGDDELVFVNREERDAVVRIYEGGEGFSLDEPTRLIRVVDTVVSTGTALAFYTSIADFDGDSLPDLVLGRWHTGTGDYQIRYWWSGLGWRTWDTTYRLIETPAGVVGPDAVYTNYAEDFDGDGIAEILGVDQYGTDAGTSLWLSRDRESARTRDYSAATVDRFYPHVVRNRGFGYVADSLQRHEMMTLLGGRDAYGFSGGLYGPNKTYDAHFGGGDGPAFGGVDAGDVNGDGWRDRLIASETYGGSSVGRAVIIAGGPYIPVDDPTVSVRSEPVAGEQAGLKLWPNPALDRVTIAWRGDLEQMPHRVVLVDIHGRTLLDRGLPTWKGTTALDVSSYPASSYRLLLYDIDGAMIAATNLILSK